MLYGTVGRSNNAGGTMDQITLQALTGAYSRNQGMMQITLKCADVVDVKKVNLHTHGMVPVGIQITVLPHRYTHYVPFSQELFISLMDLAMHNVERLQHVG